MKSWKTSGDWSIANRSAVATQNVRPKIVFKSWFAWLYRNILKNILIQFWVVLSQNLPICIIYNEWFHKYYNSPPPPIYFPKLFKHQRSKIFCFWREMAAPHSILRGSFAVLRNIWSRGIIIGPISNGNFMAHILDIILQVKMVFQFLA